MRIQVATPSSLTCSVLDRRGRKGLPALPRNSDAHGNFKQRPTIPLLRFEVALVEEGFAVGVAWSCKTGISDMGGLMQCPL